MKRVLIGCLIALSSSLVQADTNVSTSVSAGNASFDEVATRLISIPIYNFAVHNVAFSPNGKVLATGDGTGKVRLWDVQTGSLQTSIAAHTNWAFSIAWSRDGNNFATAGGDNLVHLFNAGNPTTPMKTFRGHSNDVHAVVITPDGRQMASAGDDKQIIVWNVLNGQQEKNRMAHEKQIPTLALSPDGKTLASGSRDNTIRFWDMRSGELRDTLIGHTEDVLSVRFSPDGKWLASASYDKTVRLWETTSGKAIRIFKGHTNRVFSVAFSPDGEQLASAGDSTVRIWNVKSGTSVKVISTGGTIKTAAEQVVENLSAVAFSPDGQVLAISSTTGLTFLISPKTGDVLRKLQANESKSDPGSR